GRSSWGIPPSREGPDRRSARSAPAPPTPRRGRTRETPSGPTPERQHGEWPALLPPTQLPAQPRGWHDAPVKLRLRGGRFLSYTGEGAVRGQPGPQASRARAGPGAQMVPSWTSLATQRAYAARTAAAKPRPIRRRPTEKVTKRTRPKRKLTGRSSRRVWSRMGKGAARLAPERTQVRLRMLAPTMFPAERSG